MNYTIPNQAISFDWGEGEEQRNCLITMDESDGVTEVWVVESGWKEGPDVTQERLQNQAGWVYMLTCLKAYLEHGVGDMANSMVMERPERESLLCQSCGLPFDPSHQEYRATESDGRPSDYCTYCYSMGNFTQPDATMEDVIEMGVPHLGRKIGLEGAREQLSRLIPTLNRWRIG